MPAEQASGFYNDIKASLLNDLKRTSNLILPWLSLHFGEEFAEKITDTTSQEFEKLIPEIPYIPGFRAKMLNTFLIITAQELAVYKAMKRAGKTAEEAWEICHRALKARCEEIPAWKRWFLRVLMFSPIVKMIMKKRSNNNERGRFGNFEMEYLAGKGDDFDIGVNYLQCGNLVFVKKHGGEEFAPFICMSDIALSDALGWGLQRTQTLADGCSYCDFRFKKGKKTNITSKSTHVQKTIDKISQATG